MGRTVYSLTFYWKIIPCIASVENGFPGVSISTACLADTSDRVIICHINFRSIKFSFFSHNTFFKRTFLNPPNKIPQWNNSVNQYTFFALDELLVPYPNQISPFTFEIDFNMIMLFLPSSHIIRPSPVSQSYSQCPSMVCQHSVSHIHSVHIIFSNTPLVWLGICCLFIEKKRYTLFIICTVGRSISCLVELIEINWLIINGISKINLR